MKKVYFDIRVGTSGWHYDHWRGRFYPENVPKSRWFEHYAKNFDTVEINNTFYQLPKQKTFENWYKQAPDNFLYTVKANRYITHIKRLKDAEALDRFLQTVRIFREKLGPILYQLPPSMHQDLERLRAFLRLLPKKETAVFEFRHKSWFDRNTYELLNKFGAGFCVHDMPGNPSPRVVTGKIIYLRFHGTTGRYQGNYPDSELKKWSRWVKENRRAVHTVFAYFNNDYNAYAVSNAKQMREKLVLAAKSS
jgi:uncharacterized protein YecE (DUF72 family)